MSQNDHFLVPKRRQKGPKRLMQQPVGSIHVLGAIIDPTDHRSDHFDCGVRRSRPLFDWYLAWVFRGKLALNERFGRHLRPNFTGISFYGAPRPRHECV